MGKNVPSARDEQVLVLLEEEDGRDGVLLRRGSGAPRTEESRTEDGGAG